MCADLHFQNLEDVAGTLRAFGTSRMHEGTVAKAAAPRLLFVALTACAQLTFGSALAQGEFSSVPSSYSGDENKNGSPDPFLYDQQIQYDRWQINNVYRTPSRAS
mmetsp:Transcript_12812/g.31199  ORF Transcript_12812/g.31199 Transcript_12812/m.31199 type:complete len:105 (+) Transcript_12812:256-570(+)